jgi:hypothetical protein
MFAFVKQGAWSARMGPGALVAAAVLALSAGPSWAQEVDTLGLPRVYAGIAAAVAQPLGEFDEYVNVGGGLDGFFRVRLDDAGFVSFRLHGGFLTYGNETKRVCLSETVGCRIQVDLTTSNNIFLFGLGPELAVPLGRVRLYGNGSVGFDYFSTDSNVSGTSTENPFASTRNYGDGGFSWNAGGGMEVVVAHARTLPIAIDVGLAYQGNGRREYLTRGGIIDRPDGSIDFDVKRSEANFLLWRIGASVGIRSETP